jgi:hypothetical protein
MEVIKSQIHSMQQENEIIKTQIEKGSNDYNKKY